MRPISVCRCFSGTAPDFVHLLGAAYCDVFTCDATVSGWLGDFRERLGLSRQLSVRIHPGGVPGFVQDLMGKFT
jgi:hypothetical protein